MTCQFDNKEILILIKTTSKEIRLFCFWRVTGGTIPGVGEVLKRKCPQIKVIAVETENLQCCPENK